MLLAFILSCIAGSVVAQAIAVWANGTEEYILAFMAIAPAALVALVLFLIAWTRPDPRGAIGMVALVLVLLLGALLVGFSLFSLFVNGTMAAAMREMALLVAIAGSCIVVVIVQWIVFRWRARPSAPAMPMFGRGPEAGA